MSLRILRYAEVSEGRVCKCGKSLITDPFDVIM